MPQLFIDNLKASDITQLLARSVYHAFPNPDYVPKIGDGDKDPGTVGASTVYVQSTSGNLEALTRPNAASGVNAHYRNLNLSRAALETRGQLTQEFEGGNCVLEFVTLTRPQNPRNGRMHSLYRFHFVPSELIAQWTAWCNMGMGYEWFQIVTSNKMVVRPGTARKVDFVSRGGWIDRGVLDVEVEWVPGYTFSDTYHPDDPRSTIAVAQGTIAVETDIAGDHSVDIPEVPGLDEAPAP